MKKLMILAGIFSIVGMIDANAGVSIEISVGGHGHRTPVARCEPPRRAYVKECEHQDHYRHRRSNSHHGHAARDCRFHGHGHNHR